MSTFTKQYGLAWSQFCIHYKLINHHDEHSHPSLYGEHSYYLYLPTKSRVFVKQLKFDNEQQLNYMLKQIQQSLKFNQYPELNKFIKYCVRLDHNNSKKDSRHNSPNRSINKSQTSTQKKGSLFLIYQNFKSLKQIIQRKLILPQSNKESVTKQPHTKSRSGLSPSKYVSFVHNSQQAPYFEQKTLQNILYLTFKFIKVLRQNKIDCIKSILPEIINIQNIGEVNEQCKFFLYLFSQNQIIDMLKDNLIGVQQSFVPEKVLNQLNDIEQSSRTMRVHENIPNNNFQNINFYHADSNQGNRLTIKQNSSLVMQKQIPSPTFSFSNQKNHQNNGFANFPHININQFSNKKQEKQQYDLYVQLLQSLGMLILKLMVMKINKNLFHQTKFYLMNSQYRIEIHYYQIKKSIELIKSRNEYSQNLIEFVQKLIFHNQIKALFKWDEIQKLIMKSKKQKKSQLPENLLQKNRKPFYLNNKINISRKSLQRNSSQNKLQNGRKNSLKNNKSKSKFNQTLKEKITTNEEKQKLYKKNKSISQFLQKSAQSLQKRSMKNSSHSISIVSSNQLSSTKKPISPHKSSFNQHNFQTYEKQKIIEKMENKILFDENGNRLPEIIQKSFRDGSMYRGQYNPRTNTKEGKGLYFYFEGDIYGGTWQNDQLNGLGIYNFANGDNYQGGVKEGQKDGFGVYKYENGNMYQGQWKNDKKQGQGRYFYANGDIYQGRFIVGFKQGIGIYKWRNGDIYHGNFHKNLKHGKGIFKQAKSLSTLEGTWQKDKLIPQQSVRIKYQKSKSIYQGQVTQNGIIHGIGRFISNNNCKYEGNFNSNSYEGECHITYSNGDIYKGFIKNNLFQGYGEYYFNTKNMTYKGNWKNGLQHGSGKLHFHQNGTIIDTLWQNGKYNMNKGSIYYSNRQKYEGDINQMGKHGRGKYYFSNNQWIQGHFENNQLTHIYSISSYN